MHSLRMGTRALPLPRCRSLPVLARAEPPPLPDVRAALAEKLVRPDAGPPLAQLVQGRARIVLVVPDATRSVPTALVEGLLDALDGSRVEVRIANGTHRRSTAAEQQRLLGRHWGSVPVGDRAADDASAHRSLSDEARIDRVAAEADALVLVGPASFHYLAGFGGGAKLVAPGLADRATAERVHAGCLAPGGGRHPHARAGVLAGNPLRERAEAIARLAPPQFHVIPLLDSGGRVTRLFAGERTAAFTAACDALAADYGVATRRYATVIASAGGAPYDLDFVQAHKALEAAAAACLPGGTLVLAADCGEGLSPRHRAFLERHPDAARMEEALRARFDIAGHTVWAARAKAERFRILAVTSMAPALVAALGMEQAGSLDDALGRCDLSDAVLLPFGARFLPLPDPAV